MTSGGREVDVWGAVAVSERPGYPGRRHARRALGLWVEKNPAHPPNRRALESLNDVLCQRTAHARVGGVVP